MKMGRVKIGQCGSRQYSLFALALTPKITARLDYSLFRPIPSNWRGIKKLNL